MPKIKSCEFNMDNCCIEIFYDSGNVVRLYIPDIEDDLRTTTYSFSRLQLMLDNSPLEYADLVLSGKMQEYLDRIDGYYSRQEKNIIEQLQRKYPQNIAEDIAREMLTYEN